MPEKTVPLQATTSGGAVGGAANSSRKRTCNLLTPNPVRLRGFLILPAVHLLASSVFAQLTASDVTKIIDQAVTRAVTISPNSVIAVTDREGDVLGVWLVRGGLKATDPEVATAVSKAGTA